MGIMTLRGWSRGFVFWTVDIEHKRLIVKPKWRSASQPVRIAYREWLGVEDGDPKWGNRNLAFKTKDIDLLHLALPKLVDIV